MHEFSAMNQVVETVQREAERRGAKAVAEVRLTIGKLTMLSPVQMRFAYELLVKNTPLEGSDLVIREQDAAVKCPSCGYNGPMTVEEDPIYHIAFPTLSCPRCQEVVEVVAGRECTVESVKLLL
ncbi:MAG: hydrogenase maturation nickel metallochaperone HypA [Candidatus Bathyarchaeia archaeon]